MPAFTGTVALSGAGTLFTTSVQRLRVLTPERLDGLVANLVNNNATSTGLAVANKAGSGSPTVTGITAATPNTLMQRDANGRSQVVDPAVSADIATKNYVDTTTIPATAKGAASGVASLDASGFVTAAQLGSVCRNLGSGTTFPASKNTGDIYNHTGIGCLFRWDSARWVQAGRCTVATRAARNTLLTTYGSVLPVGFRVTQSDYGWIWQKDPNGWIYAGAEMGTSVFPDQANAGPSFMYTDLNKMIPHHNVNYTVTSWIYAQAGSSDTEREIITYNSGTGNWAINDRCYVKINVHANSSIGYLGYSHLRLVPPGDVDTMPGMYISNFAKRDSGFLSSFDTWQDLEWTGVANAGSSFHVELNQYNTNNQQVQYQLYLNVTLLPC